MAILIPTQIRQANATRAFAYGGNIPASYWRLGLRWIVWGTIARFCPLYLMVVKPA